MIILVPPASPPAGNWNLPDEMQHPSAYTMSSPSAAFILEQRGFNGLGAPRAYSFGQTSAWMSRGRARRTASPSFGLTWDEFANRRLRLG